MSRDDFIGLDANHLEGFTIKGDILDQILPPDPALPRINNFDHLTSIESLFFEQQLQQRPNMPFSEKLQFGTRIHSVIPNYFEDNAIEVRGRIGRLFTNCQGQ